MACATVLVAAGTCPGCDASVAYERASFAYVLNAPSIAAIAVLVAFPIVNSAWISLHHYNLMRPHAFAFVGLDNFLHILASREFWAALLVTAEFTSLALVLLTLLGVGGALLLNAPFPGRAGLRILILIPWAIPPVVNGLMWQWIYDPKVGALNGLLIGSRSDQPLSGLAFRPRRVPSSPWSSRTSGTCSRSPSSCSWRAAAHPGRALRRRPRRRLRRAGSCSAT